MSNCEILEAQNTNRGICKDVATTENGWFVDWDQGYNIICGAPGVGKQQMEEMYFANVTYLRLDGKTKCPKALGEYVRMIEACAEDPSELIIIPMLEKVCAGLAAKGVKFAIAYSPRAAKWSLRAGKNGVSMACKIVNFIDPRVAKLMSAHKNIDRIPVDVGVGLDQAIIDYQNRKSK